MFSEDTKILEFDQHQQSEKKSSIVYADLECWIKKIDGCESDSQKNASIINQVKIFRVSIQGLQHGELIV